LDSCGFEHVFVGETKRDKQILGLHNWVQFYLQEKRNQIDYKGYVARKNKSRPDEDDQVLSLQFAWKGLVKPIGSIFIGVSPEFEFALYTIVFLLSEKSVTHETVKIEEYELQIVVCRHGQHIGTAYPVLLGTSTSAWQDQALRDTEHPRPCRAERARAGPSSADQPRHLRTQQQDREQAGTSGQPRSGQRPQSNGKGSESELRSSFALELSAVFVPLQTCRTGWGYWKDMRTARSRCCSYL
ncbi:PREDICTED: poly(U)-specific endoribonuclease-like, partial [Tinamus guttatus]|uniref:poly(U)-specific endoribonuclease-like n=1 Tax=Tinamus guttatus TaxID=94827 RepID=UPI00052F141A